MIRKNKIFPSLNVINGKTSPYESKGIIRHHYYWSDPKLGPGIVAIRIITCSCHDCISILSLSWDSKTKESVNQTRYVRAYDCKYSQIIDCHNNWILMIVFIWRNKWMNNIKKKLIKLFLMVMWWTCIWSLWRKIWCNCYWQLFMSWLLYHQIFFISVYPSIRLEYWWTSYLIWRNCMWRNLFLFNQY